MSAIASGVPGEPRMIIAGSDQYVFPFINGGAFRLTTKKWPDWYVCMQDNTSLDVKGKKGHPGMQGEFKFTRHSSGYYLISPVQWPTLYLYIMQNEPSGNVKGWEGDPGPQGHWLITPRQDGSILLSTEKWYSWYMYMQNWVNGDVLGTKEPNEQAHFILSCDIQLKSSVEP